MATFEETFKWIKNNIKEDEIKKEAFTKLLHLIGEWPTTDADYNLMDEVRGEIKSINEKKGTEELLDAYRLQLGIRE
jgi:hypothetical protein